MDISSYYEGEIRKRGASPLLNTQQRQYKELGQSYLSENMVAERVGFEPTVAKGYTRSPGAPDRPLQHLSTISD